MAGWTKADFDASYRFRVERYLDGHPNTRAEVQFHYARGFVAPLLLNRWQNVIPSILDIQSTDHVVIVGAGFGWGVEAVISLTGANVIGVDTSDFVQSAGSTDELTELDAAIALVGLDPDGPRGLEIKAEYHTPGPRSTTVVLQEEMKTNQSRNLVRQTLGNNIPTFIITEDMIQLLPDADITAWVTEIDKVGAIVVHITGGKPRTATELNAFTGHKCIDYGTTPYEVVG